MPLYIELKKIKFKDPNLGLKVILIIHFLLTTLGAMGSFSPFVYLFYNICLIAPLFWTIYCGKTNKDFFKLAIILNMCSIILDALYIVLSLDHLGDMKFNESVSSLMALLHLVFRPFSILLLMKHEDKRRNAFSGGEIDEEMLDNVKSTQTILEGEIDEEMLDNVKSTQTILEGIHFDFPTMKKTDITIT